MSAENKALIRRWFDEVWNSGREAAIDEMMAEDCVAHGLTDSTGAEIHGVAAFKTFFHSFRNAFPDIKVSLDHVMAENDIVVARCTVRAVHRGNGIGIEATHKPIHITGMSMTRIEEGKIVEAWNSFDFMTMFQQIGAVELPGGKAV